MGVWEREREAELRAGRSPMTGVVASKSLCRMVSQTLWRSNARKAVSHQTQGLSGSRTFTKVPGTFVEVLGRSAESPRTSVKVLEPESP